MIMNSMRGAGSPQIWDPKEGKKKCALPFLQTAFLAPSVGLGFSDCLAEPHTQGSRHSTGTHSPTITVLTSRHRRSCWIQRQSCKRERGDWRAKAVVAAAAILRATRSPNYILWIFIYRLNYNWSCWRGLEKSLYISRVFFYLKDAVP